MRAALDLTVLPMDLDVTGIFFIVLTFEDTHFGICWYGTSFAAEHGRSQSVGYAASGEFGKDGALLVLCSWGGDCWCQSSFSLPMGPTLVASPTTWAQCEILSARSV